MAAYRVLIVDDQKDIRRLLRSGLESLTDEIEVIDVPSGEEAILVISRQPIDLLVTDILLPGISGLELTERTEIRNPGLKLVLMTGLSEPKIRRQVANAGADAFFFKPFELKDVLDTIQELLGLVKPELPGSAEDELGEEPQTLSERLVGLREQLDVLAAALVDERGEIVAQAGALPDEASSEALLSALVTTCSAARKVALPLGENTFRDLFYFPREIYDLVVSNVDGSLVLLLVTSSADWNDALLSSWMGKIRLAVQDLQKILSRMGVTVEDVRVDQPADAIADEFEGAIDLTEALPELDAVFEKAEQEIDSEEVDAFWESLASEEIQADQITRADAISYEQAQQLGLTPEED